MLSTRSRLFLASLPLVTLVVGSTLFLAHRAIVEELGQTTALNPQIVQGVERAIFVTGAVGFAIALVVSFIGAHWLSTSLSALLESVRKTTTGDKVGLSLMSRRDEIGGLARIVRNLSEEVEALIATQTEERDRFNAVLQGMDAAVIALDPLHRILLMNRSARELFGFAEAPIGRLVAECIRTPKVVEVLRENRTLSAPLEFEFRSPRGKYLLARLTPQRNTPGSVLVLHDISELRRLERVRRDFFTNVSHELRTPVAIIRSAAENLTDGALDSRPHAERFVASILRNSERISTLLAEVMDLASLESGAYRLNPEDLNVSDVVRGVIEALQPLADEKRISCTAELDGPLNAQVDRLALEHILSNLLTNAIKYTQEEGSVRVTATEHAGQITVAVEDDGPGIAPQHHTRLFERFYRIDSGRARKQGGAGLGLSIAKHLTTAIGGEISFDSAYTSGARFAVQFRTQHDL